MKPLGDTARLWAVLQDGEPHPAGELDRLVQRGTLTQRIREVRARYGVKVDCFYSKGPRSRHIARGTWIYQARVVS